MIGGEDETLSKFQQDALSVHNEYRSKHGVDSLKMSDDLCKTAQDWAEHLAKNDLFEHSKCTDIGENVAMHYSSATTAYSGEFNWMILKYDTRIEQMKTRPSFNKVE